MKEPSMASERWVVKITNGYYWGVSGRVRCWGSRNDAKIYRSRFHAHVDMAEWPESTFDREQPRIVHLRPKAPVRDEAAIRRDERVRIAGMLHGDCTGAYLGETRLSSNSTYRFTVEALRIAIISKDWPVAK